MQEFIDFVNKNASNVWLFLEIVAAITGIILFKKYKHTQAKYFIYFLVYVVFFVIIGKYSHFVRNDGFFNFLEGTLLEKNYWWFTICWRINATLFFGWYFLKILRNSATKRVLKVSLILFLVISIIAIVTTLPMFFKTNIPIINIMSGLIILQCVAYYFLEILQSDRVLTFHKSLNFYICCAILVLWLIQTPLVFFEHYFSLADMDYVYLRGQINFIAIPFMYITYTIGLIVSNPDYV